MIDSRTARFAVLVALLLAPLEAPAPIRVTPEPEPLGEPRAPGVEQVQVAGVTVEPLEAGGVHVAAHVRGLTGNGADVVDFGGLSVSLYEDDEPVSASSLAVSEPPEGAPGFVLGFDASADGRAHEIKVVIAGHSAAASVVYPAPPWPLWVWSSGAVAGLIGVAGLGLALSRRRAAGSLAFLSGPQAGTSYRLASGTTRIGAVPENDLVLSSTQVSRFHAEISARARRVEIRDLHSTNGTLVNGHRVEQAVLNPGDKIRIGDVELFFDR